MKKCIIPYGVKMFQTKVISLLIFEVLENHFLYKDLFLKTTTKKGHLMSKYRTTIETYNTYFFMLYNISKFSMQESLKLSLEYKV